MSIRDLNRRHLFLVGLFSTRHAVRGGSGLIFFLLVLAGGLLIASLVIDSVEAARKQLETLERRDVTSKEALDQVQEFAGRVVSWALGESSAEDLATGRAKQPWADYLMNDRPALLSAVLLILVFALPFLTVFGAFNQYSGDVGSRGIRYQLLRTERANIYFGRYLGTILYSAATMLLLILTIVGYMGLKLEFYGWGELLGWGVRGWIALVVLVIPYTALCGWISGAIDSPFAALVLCILAVAAAPLVAFIAGLKWDDASYVKWVLPWGVQNRLLHYSGTQCALAVLACLGYAAVFLTVGYRNFAKRDL